MVTWWFFHGAISASPQDRPAPAMNHGRAAEEVVVCLAAEGGKHGMQRLAVRQRGGLVVKLDAAPKALCLIPVMLLKRSVEELDTGSGSRSLCKGLKAALHRCHGADRSVSSECGEGPSRKQTDLDPSQSIPTSLRNTAPKAQSPLPGCTQTSS